MRERMRDYECRSAASQGTAFDLGKMAPSGTPRHTALDPQVQGICKQSPVRLSPRFSGTGARQGMPPKLASCTLRRTQASLSSPRAHPQGLSHWF